MHGRHGRLHLRLQPTVPDGAGEPPQLRVFQKKRYGRHDRGPGAVLEVPLRQGHLRPVLPLHDRGDYTRLLDEGPGQG